MSDYITWNLYGKHLSGAFLDEEQLEPLFNQLEDISADWYDDMAKEDLLVCFSTECYGGYEDVISAITNFSRELPDAVFLLECHDIDEFWYQQIYFQNGDREEIDGEITYDEPQRIRYDPQPKEPWKAYCRYLRKWASEHDSLEFEGSCPVRYNEFLNQELSIQGGENA